MPLLTRPIGYQTTLNPAHAGHPFHTQILDTFIENNNNLFHLLPNSKEKNYSEIVQKTLPYGMHWYNPKNNNHVFISFITALTFAGIEENFKFSPVDRIIRQEMLTAVQDMLQELRDLVWRHDQKQKKLSIPNVTPTPNKEPLDKTTPLRKTAWMEINIFGHKRTNNSLPEEQQKIDTIDQQQRQDQLIEYILRADLDSLWISMTPNIYYSPIARHTKETHFFLDSIAQFTKKLSEASKKEQKTIPKILVGFEIANNLYEPNMPNPCAHDLYGNIYEDVPSPLNQSFWHNEVRQPLQTLVNEWNKTSISNGIPLSGVVLDLEMYGRKKTGTFLTSMGFNKKTFNKFSEQFSLQQKDLSINDIVKTLMQQQLTKNYFEYLEEEAQKIGRSCKEFFEQQIPECMIACYSPNIPTSWFYKGFFKGLSKNDKRLNLWTFNSDFLSHKSWFQKNNINVSHSSVLLLSKIKSIKDASWIDSILNNHNGIWLNRFSRLVEDYNPKSWTSIEQTPLDYDNKNKLMDYIRNIE